MTTTAAGEIVTVTREWLAQDAQTRALDGREGTNRCRSRTNQLGEDIDHDIAAVFAWIRHRARSEKTRQVFLSEVRRLYYWLFLRARKPLSSLTLADLEEYRAFLRKPPKAWIGPKLPYLDRQTGGINPRWRPFQKPMTEAHVAHVFGVLKSLFKFLTDMGYLDGNPLVGLPAKEKTEIGDDRARQARPTERALDEEQWNAVLAAVEALPRTTQRAQAEYERARFIVRLVYHLGARITEITRHRMEHFVQIDDRWQWSVVGKGGKFKMIGVNSELLAALARYRQHLGLPPLPLPGEKNPIVFNIHGKKALSTRQLFDIIKTVFAQAAERLMATDPHKAHRLRAASPHWIRHATASHLAGKAKNIEELKAIQEHLRHSNLNTTLGYTHVRDEAAATVAERLVTKTNAAK